MDIRTKFNYSMTGALSASAVILGMASNAYAAIPLASAIPTVVLQVGSANYTYTSNFGGSGVFAPGSSVNITNSRHNLGTTNTLGSNHTLGSGGTGPGGTSVLDNAGNVVGTNQICVFCHTPHGFNAVQSGPLWNKSVNSSSTYAVYNTGTNVSSTLDADKPSIGSVSLACLSCHDGTQAMDNMINGPGSGLMASGYDGSLSSTSASSFYITGSWPRNGDQVYTWGDTAGGFAQMGQGGSAYTGAANGDTPALEGILLGTDLSNDHPISVQYCGGGISLNLNSDISGATVARGTCRDRLFNLPTVTKLDEDQRFWVDTNIILDSDAVAVGSASIGGTGAYPISRDPTTVELYVTNGTVIANSTAGTANMGTVNIDDGMGNPVAVTECGNGNNGDACGRGFVSSLTTGIFTPVPGAGIRTKQDIMLFTNNAGVVDSPSVECSSCHDPHTPNNGTFLRVSNQGSGLCLSCHVK